MAGTTNAVPNPGSDSAHGFHSGRLHAARSIRSLIPEAPQPEAKEAHHVD